MDFRLYAAQEAHVSSFISPFYEKWCLQGGLEGEVVMDIGCGPGNTSTKMLLQKFPNLKSLVAIDNDEETIQFARKHYSSEKVQFEVADILDEASIARWKGKMSKVISTFCLHWLDDQERAFRNIYSLLKVGGQAALSFVTISPIYDANLEIVADPKWREILKDKNTHIPQSQFRSSNQDHYRETLSQVGFSVIMCKEESYSSMFSNHSEMKDFIASFNRVLPHISEDMKEDFKNDLLKKYIRHGVEKDGCIVHTQKLLVALVSKPL